MTTMQNCRLRGFSHQWKSAWKNSHLTNCDRWPKIIYVLKVTVTNQKTPTIISDQSKLSLHIHWPIRSLHNSPVTNQRAVMSSHDHLTKFVLEPGPEDCSVKCRITRNCKGIDKGIFHCHLKNYMNLLIWNAGKLFPLSHLISSGPTCGQIMCPERACNELSQSFHSAKGRPLLTRAFFHVESSY